MIAPQPSPVSELSFTGERMIPHASDIATELFHWQRYLYFRPWYEGKRVVDAASGEGYGISYVANFAASATGVEIDAQSVRHGRAKYGNRPKPAHFREQSVCDFDYSNADLVISFETIEHLSEPEAFLRALSTCPGQIVISTPNRLTHSPGNGPDDKPLNPFHVREWTPTEFARLIHEHFPRRTVRFLSQQATWPGTIRPVEAVTDDANYVIAVIGEGELPHWPRLGIAVPTVNGSARCRDVVIGMTRHYPGDIEFAIVDNGSRPDEAQALEQLHADFPNHVHLVHLKQNVGYGRGANVGLDYLWQEAWFDFFAVSNDDVLPAVDCLPQMVSAMRELEAAGHKPGVIGPVTNEISGQQRVEIGAYNSYAEMIDRAEQWHAEHHSSGTQVNQVRGLFMLIHPECLSDVGGFDPRFGLGNFEDDDHNLRCRLAGYSLWIADGAFLHHQGSTTFGEIQIDYESNIQRNLQLFCEKWQMKDFSEFLTHSETEIPLYVPLGASIEPSGFVMTLRGETFDLVHQASDMEFVAYIHNRLQGRPRGARLDIIRALEA